MVISLREVVDTMQIGSDELHSYLNKVTGELVTISNDDISVIESGDDWSGYPDWQQDILRDAQKVLSTDDYLSLPSQFDIHEYEIMERFCLSLEDERLSDELLYQIRGSGAFRRFNEAIYRYGIEQDWFQFKEQAYGEIAIAWLEDHGIAYINDLRSKLG
jgi:hypothetical protein